MTDAFFSWFWTLWSVRTSGDRERPSGEIKPGAFFFWRDLTRVPLYRRLLRMIRNGGMDYTREAPGGCCPAALYYDRKVR